MQISFFLVVFDLCDLTKNVKSCEANTKEWIGLLFLRKRGEVHGKQRRAQMLYRKHLYFWTFQEKDLISLLSDIPAVFSILILSRLGSSRLLPNFFVHLILVEVLFDVSKVKHLEF